MGNYRDQDRWHPSQENGGSGERRPWEGYGPRNRQAPDYGSAGGQYTSRVGPDQDPYTEDEGAYAGVRNRAYGGQGNYNQSGQRDWEREGRGGAGGYGQVGGQREQAQDEGRYSRGSRRGGQRFYGQGGYGEEQDWGRDRGDHDRGVPPDASQLAYGPGSQNYGQAVGNYQGASNYAQSGRGSHSPDRGDSDDNWESQQLNYGALGPVSSGQRAQSTGYGQGAQQGHEGSQFDPDYHNWRQEQARKYDEDYGSWRETQLKQHDEDYGKWRKERQDKFGNDFSAWRSKNQARSSERSDNASQSGSSSQNPASSGSSGSSSSPGSSRTPGPEVERKH